MAGTADYGLGPHTFPRGWFMIADAGALKEGKPLSLRFFGNDLVLYRGRASGEPVLLDAYCPHMGTHLGRNSTSYVVHDERWIEGDSIRCPYHAWRFGPDGRCNEIPYLPDLAIPKAAKVRSWRTLERMGAIFAWQDAEGGEPDVEVPYLPEWDDPAWVRWQFDDFGTLACHPVEIIDNIVDVAHQGPIHGQALQYFEVEFREHQAYHREGGISRTALSGEGAELSIDAAYHGPGILLSALGGQLPSYFLIAHTPVEDGSVRVWHAALVRSPNQPVGPEDVAMARAFQAASRDAFAQDFEIWANKRPAKTIMQLPADGCYAQARRWYRQFFNPRAEAARIVGAVQGTHGVPWLPRRPTAVAPADS